MILPSWDEALGSGAEHCPRSTECPWTMRKVYSHTLRVSLCSKLPHCSDRIGGILTGKHS
jgi:hypothetical protein